jgi:hypothetical protein
VRAPVHIWFVIALGLALAAASGSAWLSQRFTRPWLVAAILLVTAADLWYWNMATNPLAYGRASFPERYGNAYENYQSHLAPIKQRPFYRIWAPFTTNAFGPLNSSLESRTEVTYGYNPLELARYGDYIRVAQQNPRLLNGLAVTHKIDAGRGALIQNTDALPRATTPRNVHFVAGKEAALAALATLDPATSAVVEAPARTLVGSDARIEILNYEDDRYRIRYSAAAESLLRIAVPFFPGWSATVDGQSTPVLAVDYALSGVVVPAGNHELEFRYRSRWFRCGAVLSALTIVLCLGLILSSAFARRAR